MSHLRKVAGTSNAVMICGAARQAEIALDHLNEWSACLSVKTATKLRQAISLLASIQKEALEKSKG